ncbi:hypothetical protein SprV_0501777700 [Sparganum proliferum]
MDIIRQSESSWTSPLHMISLAATVDWRPCGDYRALNNVAVPERRFEDGQKHPFGLFEFLRIPFGLLNASQTFHSFVDRVLRGLQFVYVNIDDLLCADNILPLTSLLYGPKRSFELSADALAAFDKVKADLADVTLRTHFSPDAPISLMVDASNVAVGAVLQQYLAGRSQPLAFFSRKLAPAETRYSTFGRELPAVFLTVKHFRHFLEGRECTVFTDLQPLSFALKSRPDKLNPREIRQLDYISQFTSDTRHVDRSISGMAGALPRPSIAHLQLSPGIDLAEMAAEQRRVCSPCDDDVSELRLQDLPLTTRNGTILCDVSTTSHRPFVPPSLRCKVFFSLRHLSHPGSRATNNLFSDRFVWPGMHKDLTALIRACFGCQRNKVQQHNKAPIGTFGCTVRSCPPGHLATFGVPSTITTDRGGQFESNLFQSLLSFLGRTRIRNTAYHPTANGMVKRFHRQLKASLRAADDPENWTDHFLLVRLGIRSSLKSDLDCSAAELVFGDTVRLPGQKISPTPRVAVEDPTNLLHRLRQFMRTLSPVPPRSFVYESYLEKDLATCSNVYLRCDRVRRPPEPPYDGPFRVISRGTKNFRIQRGTREEVVSVDRLKAAVQDTSPDESCVPLPCSSSLTLYSSFPYTSSAAMPATLSCNYPLLNLQHCDRKPY